MSWTLTAADQAHAIGAAWLAQAPGNLQPEAPPGSDGLIRLVRWLMWLVMLAGMSAIIFAGGKFGWEKWQGVGLESPKIILGALIGGIVSVSAGTIMNAVVLTTP